MTIDYASKHPERIPRNYTVINHWTYHHIRSGLSLFGSRSKGEITDRREENVNNVPFTRPGDNCKYCPFQLVCEESQLYK